VDRSSKELAIKPGAKSGVMDGEIAISFIEKELAGCKFVALLGHWLIGFRRL
jgi:hypothetical protein